jgi:hypothetical protein
MNDFAKEMPWELAERKAKQMTWVYMQNFRSKKTYSDAVIQGWGYDLEVIVKKVSEAQARFIAGCKTSFYPSHILADDDEYNKIRNIVQRGRTLTSIDVTLPHSFVKKISNGQFQPLKSQHEYDKMVDDMRWYNE